MKLRPTRARHIADALVAAVLVLAGVAWAQAQQQQIGALVSPGPLSKAHSKLEGLANCQKCHEPGRKVTAERCLACHKPIAEKIAARKGVHRNVTDDCVSCHVEHAGADAETRPIDRNAFNHAAETGFALDGKHTAIATDCAKCHKSRSFLGLSAACASCHQDPHQGRLGTNCVGCHSTAVAFRETASSFDHSKTAFPLSEAHRSVACTKCHVNKVYKGLKFAACTDCHTDPHRQQFGFACANCHAGATWKTEKVDHAKTAFPLVGRHAGTQCASCHKQPPMRAKLEFARCASCHADPHRGEFPQDCGSCHTPARFRQEGFDHLAKTKFALLGRHGVIPCASCHKGASTAAPGATLALDFRGLKTACASCHTDVHGGKLGANCSSCHDTASFRVAAFKHPGPPEFYGGQHASVSCGKCHGGEGVGKAGLTGQAASQRTFRGLSKECASCHRDIHLGQLGTQCQTCHSIDAAKFAAVGFSHARTAFQLSGTHATVACSKCHKSEPGGYPAGSGTAVHYAGLSTQCQNCHNDVHLGQLGARCESCHVPTSFKLATYTHRGDAALHTDKHASAPCQACHKSKEADYPVGHGVAVEYAALSPACTSCHADPHHGTLGTRCETCHTPHQWPGASRAFHKATIFPLEGQHQAVPCASCHIKGQTKGTPDRCYDCHWIRRQDDRFRTLLGSDCAQCHNPTSWRFVNWDHAVATGFELAGAHSTLDCQSCHRDLTFQAGMSTACFTCHLQDFTGTRNPSHVASGFPTTCDTCHNKTSKTWTEATFNHAATAFPLLGVHATQACNGCHGDGVFKGKSTACVSCHQTDFNNSKNPNHASVGFSTACDTCHKVSNPSWTQATFNHATTAFPLLGVHATQACTACHGDGVYKGKSTACVACHQTDFNNSKNPSHVASGFPTTCDTCHKVSDTSWSQGVFTTHSSVFPLAGVHATTACANCHVNNNYSSVPTTCAGCHLSTYQTAATPVNHAGLPTTCETCHGFSDAAWTLASSFKHANYFPLAGAHTTAACASCHTNGNYTTVPTSPCYACHATDYQNAATPVNHIASNFPTTCDTCHKFSDTSWTQGVFNHSTVFPLSGVHATTACANCHINNNYSSVPTNCAGCHLQTYQTATSPVNHAGLPTTCDTCHSFSDAAWTLASSFKHANYFPLAGAHTTAACASCHTNGNYTTVPTSPCYACHATDYQNAVSPVNHIAAGFPTTCDTCHKFSDTSWTQAVFNHTWFPTNHGNAGGVCATCHINRSNYAVFSCTTGCHPASDVNPRHTQVAGYVYDSNACYSCHPTGRGR